MRSSLNILPGAHTGSTIVERCTDEMVCHCLQLTRQALEDALGRQPLFTINDLRKHTGAGDGCTSCHRALKQLLHETVFTVQSTARCG